MAETNYAQHGVRMEAGAEVFSDPTLLVEEDAFARGEQRFLAIGWGSDKLLTVVFSEPGDHTIRLISVRPATPAEKKKYARSLS